MSLVCPWFHLIQVPAQALYNSHAWAVAQAEVVRVRQLDGARGRRLQLRASWAECSLYPLTGSAPSASLDQLRAHAAPPRP